MRLLAPPRQAPIGTDPSTQAAASAAPGPRMAGAYAVVPQPAGGLTQRAVVSLVLLTTVILPTVLTWMSATAAAHADEGGIPLHFPVVVKRPMVIKIDQSISATVRVSSDDFQWDDDFSVTEDIVLVDEYLEFDPKTHKEVGTRHFVWAKSTYNKEVSDSALNGVRATYTLANQDAGWEVRLADNRALTGELFDSLLALSGSLGVWVALPERAHIGGRVELDLTLLTALLLGTYRDAQSNAKLILESYDSDKHVARLTGTATFQGSVDVADTPTVIRSSGQLTLEVSHIERRIVKLDFKGTLAFEGSGSAQVTGGGPHTFELTTDIDEKDVAYFSKQKARVRDRRVRAPRLGVGFLLPSTWTRVRAEGLNQRFIRTTDHDKGEAVIDLQMLDGDSSYQPGLFFDQLYVALKKDYPNLIYEKTRNPLGSEQGRVYYIPPAEEGRGGSLLQVEVYPYRGKFLMFRLSGPLPAYRAAHKDFQRAKGSMGILRPKRS